MSEPEPTVNDLKYEMSQMGHGESGYFDKPLPSDPGP